MKLNKKQFNIALAKSCLSLSELSRASGVGNVTLTRICKGIQQPRPKTIGKIAKAMNVDVTELIEE